MVGLVAAGFTLLLGHAMVAPFGHDEHQFVFSGQLLADQALLPYLDFPYNHSPYLVFLYGALFKLTDFDLLAARAISALGALATVAMLYGACWRSAVGKTSFWKYWISAGAVVILLANPIFQSTTGKAWNHDVAGALVLGALLLLPRGGERQQIRRRLVLSGLLLGLAVGVRLSYAAALPAFLILLYWVHEERQLADLAKRALNFWAGFITALLPLLVLIVLAPARFVFGNWVYQLLNTEYRRVLGHEQAMSLAGKGAYLLDRVGQSPSNLILPVGFAILALTMIRSAGRTQGHPFRGPALMALFLFVGALVPTPSWPQYFYAPLPFLILGAAYATLREGGKGLGIYWRRLAFGAMVLLSFAEVIRSYSPIEVLQSKDGWVPLQVDELGERIASRVGEGRVLTLAPLIPAEAGLTGYPEFATGPFVWRVAPMLSAEKRATYGLISPDELSALLAQRPPDALLTGFEQGSKVFDLHRPGGLEDPLIEYAQQHGFKPISVPTDLVEGEITLWLP